MTKADLFLARFDEAIQSVLDNPLDTVRVLEWTALRSEHAGA